MNITPAGLNRLFQNLSTLYQGAYENTPTIYSNIATVIPSSTRTTVYGWLDKLPILRQWVGPRVVNNAIAQAQSITNLLYEDTCAIKRVDIEDELMAVFGLTPKMLGMQAALWPDIELTKFIELATVGLGFDGQPFFNASHPTDTATAGSTLQSNLFNQANGGATALSQSNIDKVWSAMAAFKGRDSQVLGVNARTLMVPPQLKFTALAIANADFTVQASAGNAATGGASNVFKGAFDVVVNSRLTSATAWYLMDTSFPIKPFVWQLREAPSFTWRNQPNDENVFVRDEYEYGVRARGAPGTGLWFLAAKADSA